MNLPASTKYKLSIAPGLYNVMGFGEVDLRSLTLAQADALFKRGFPYLTEIPVKVSKAPVIKEIPTNKFKKREQSRDIKKNNSS